MLTYNNKYRFDNLVALLEVNSGDYIHSEIALDYIEKVDVNSYLAFADAFARGSTDYPVVEKSFGLSMLEFYKLHRDGIIDWLENESGKHESDSTLNYIKNVVENESGELFQLDHVSKALYGSIDSDIGQFYGYDKIANSIVKLVIKNIGQAYLRANSDYEYLDIPEVLLDFIFAIEYGHFYNAGESLVDQFLTWVGATNFTNNAMVDRDGVDLAGTEAKLMLPDGAVEFYRNNKKELRSWLDCYVRKNENNGVIEFVSKLMMGSDCGADIDSIAIIMDGDNKFYSTYDDVVTQVVYFFGEQLRKSFQDFTIGS